MKKMENQLRGSNHDLRQSKDKLNFKKDNQGNYSLLKGTIDNKVI